MPIFHEYKAIQIHIPKTAGTSIAFSLGLKRGHIHQNNKANQEHWLFGPASVRTYGAPYQHLGTKQIKEVIGEEIHDEYFKFSFVRNPWDRVASEFFWAKQNTEAYAFNNNKFEDLIRDLEEGKEKENKYQNRLRAQTSFLKDEQGKIDVDFVGKYENLKNDWVYICSALGVPLLHSQEIFNDDMLGFLINNSDKTIYTRVNGGKISEVIAKGKVPAFPLRDLHEGENNDVFVIEAALEKENLKEGRADIVESVDINLLKNSKKRNIKYYHGIFQPVQRISSGCMDEFFNFDINVQTERFLEIGGHLSDYNQGREGPFVIDVVKTFKTNKGDYRECYNDWSRKVVEKFYEEDIDAFKYTF